MNNIHQRNFFDKQISNYVAFLKIATRSQAIKISKEIVKLSNRISVIEDMGWLEQKKEVPTYFETKQSKLNFKTIETPTDMSKKKRNAPENCHPIHDEAKDSRNRALQLAREHKDIKPIRYILKH
jgi:hypothetical protein